ncbi:MAG: hypothetical protein MK193_05675 [Lentisphaeria bacterium]|nr:hypothetical protein [Lentisphaeria bacterium]
MILSTAIIFSLILFFNFKVGIKKHYFVSTADKIAHLVIIANILIEGSIHALTMQEGDKIGYDFYFHALGYVVVIGLYRFFMLSTQHVSAKKEPEK